jgi:RNA polymerase sigma factor (sigma-70 family)
MMGADYIVQFKVKNGPMLRAMRKMGYSSAAELSRDTSVGNGEIGRYLNLSKTPINRRGEWCLSIMKIAEVLHTMPEDLFPPQHIRERLDRNTAECEMSIDDVAALASSGVAMIDYNTPEAAALKQVNRDLMEKWLGQLLPRERYVIDMRYGLSGEEHQQGSVAKLMGISKGRVSQIEAKAIRKLQRRSVEHKNINKVLQAGAE